MNVGGLWFNFFNNLSLILVSLFVLDASQTVFMKVEHGSLNHLTV